MPSMNNYHAFMLNIQSELPFPELFASTEPRSDDLNKITIKFGEVSSHGLDELKQAGGPFYQATKKSLWLNVPNVARFLITNGNQIIIDAFAGIDQDSLRVFILGSCMGALLMQRDLFLLHGNAIKVGNHCVSFVGPSGIGKSTLSGGFFKRGYSILADDVCVVSKDGCVMPSFPQIKLWFDAATFLSIDTQSLRRIRPCLEKFAVPLAQQFHHEALPLRVVYVLQTHNKDEFSFTNVNGMQKLQPLQNNIYRKNYLKSMDKSSMSFKQCAQIASQTNVVRIARPNDGFKLDKLIDLIEDDLVKQERHHAS